MMHGRNNGKKLMAVRIIRHAMEIIHLLTDLNPIQVIVDAVVNRCPNTYLIYLLVVAVLLIFLEILLSLLSLTCMWELSGFDTFHCQYVSIFTY